MDQSAKRRRLAENAVILSGRLVEVLQGLAELKEERSQAGNFTDAEMADVSDGFDLRHLDAFLVGTFLDNTVPALMATYEANKAIILKVKR